LNFKIYNSDYGLNHFPICNIWFPNPALRNCCQIRFYNRAIPAIYGILWLYVIGDILSRKCICQGNAKGVPHKPWQISHDLRFAFSLGYAKATPPGSYNKSSLYVNIPPFGQNLALPLDAV